MVVIKSKIVPLFLCVTILFSTSGFYSVTHICDCVEEIACNAPESECCSIYDSILGEESDCCSEHPILQENQNCTSDCLDECTYSVERKIINPDQLPIDKKLIISCEYSSALIFDTEEINKNSFNRNPSLTQALLSPDSFGKNLIIELHQIKIASLI